MKNFNSWGESDELRVARLEAELGFALPDDYRSFLLRNNGGSFQEQVFFVADLGQDVMLDIFYAVSNPDRVLTLSFWWKEHGEELQENALIIGTDPGGGMITYITTGEDKGVYYWDHAHFFEESAEEEGNTYFVADSFADFCKLPRPFVTAVQRK